jgi:hypothetical protein
MRLIETKTLTAATTSIEFTSIPQTFTDLLIVLSVRANLGSGYAFDDLGLRINGDAGNNYSNIILRSRDGSVLGTGGAGTSITVYSGPAASATANTFGSSQIYLSDYTSGTTYKSVLVDGYSETNSTTAVQGGIVGGLWQSASPITSVNLVSLNGWNFAQHSLVSIYGITKGSDGTTTAS